MFEKLKSRKPKVTFQNFLCRVPASDYIFQKTPYDEQIQSAAKAIQHADLTAANDFREISRNSLISTE